LKDLAAYGRIILKWVIKKEKGMTWTGFVWLRIMVGSCKGSIELKSFVKFEVFLD